MRKSIITLMSAVALTCTVAANSWAVPADEAVSYMNTMGERAVAVLNSPDDMLVRFNRVLTEGIDFEWISRKALGRAGRRITPTQLTEISGLMARQVTETTLGRLREATVVGFTIGKVRQLPNDEALVQTTIEFDRGQAIDTGWRVAARGGTLRIVDVEFEGYSMRIHFQNQFERKLRFGGIDGLIKSLRKNSRGRSL